MRSRSRLGLAGIALTTVLTLAGCGDESGPDTATDPAAAPTPTPTATATGSCTYAADGSAAAKKVDPPSGSAPRTGQVDVEIATSIGPVTATLDADATPCTVTSFVSLAEQGYFDKTSCHRLTTPPASISVLQCGDPLGSGVGGPGYSFADELTGSETYPAGTLAMANAGPDTNGSQFFMVYADSTLDPAYTVFGQLDEQSTELLVELAEAGTATGQPDGPPATPVTITSVAVAG